jgi:hypothetical protein
MNQSLLESPELQQAHVVLRQALVDHADVVRADTLSQPNPSVAVLTNPERVDLQRTIAESSITDGELSNNDIDSLVDLFDAWLERRPSSLNT